MAEFEGEPSPLWAWPKGKRLANAIESNQRPEKRLARAQDVSLRTRKNVKITLKEPPWVGKKTTTKS